MGSLKAYLSDPFLRDLYRQIRAAGPVRSISVDLTHKCNLRCKGCYYFAEDMDAYQARDEEEFDGFLQSEAERGTNFMTIVGGEPTLVMQRIKKIYDRFKCSVATNGLRRIPYEGFEQLPIGVAIWGDRQTDAALRAPDESKDLFSRALKNYRGDSRAFFYYTVAPGTADQIESVVEECVQNGNAVLFNYYSDLAGLGGPYDYRQGFDRVRREIDRMIERYPDRILLSSYFNRVISSGRLYDMTWGYDVCTNLSTNYEANQERLANGHPYNPHFRAYFADFKTVRRCCTGIHRDCDSCFDTWEHFSWIMIHLRKHLGSKQEFTHWLTTMYLFYLINRLVDYEEGIKLLPEIHSRVGVNPV